MTISLHCQNCGSGLTYEYDANVYQKVQFDNDSMEIVEDDVDGGASIYCAHCDHEPDTEQQCAVMDFVNFVY